MRWAAGVVALAGVIAWFALDAEAPPPRCAADADCGMGARCVGERCEPVPLASPIRLVLGERGAVRPVLAPCGDGVCDLALGECEGACPADCPGVPCAQPCVVDGVCAPWEGPGCPDCMPAGCNFDGLCTVGESPRCPDCSCGDGYCDTAAGECVDTCPADCPNTPCAERCNFDAVCDEGESPGCPDCSCGDGLCDPALEDCAICPYDCGSCADEPDCVDCDEDGFFFD